MEQERLDELNELRFRQLEKLTSAFIEGQQDSIQILTEHTRRLGRIEKRLDSLEKRMDSLEKRMDSLEKRMDSLEKRMDRVEELLTLALDDLAFIREILKPGE